MGCNARRSTTVMEGFLLKKGQIFAHADPRDRMFQIKELFNQMDTNGDQLVNWEEFRRFWDPTGQHEEEAKAMFDDIDQLGTGTLSLAKFDLHFTHLTMDHIRHRFR